MPRVDHWQGSFAAGEISPLLRGKPDTAAYAEGLATSVNGLIGPHGQWMRRPGTLLRDWLDGAGGDLRLFAFSPAVGQSFMLLFEHQSCSVYVVNRVDLPQAPIATFPTPFHGTEVDALSLVQSGNTLFLAHPAHAPQMIGFDGGVGFQLQPLSFVDGPYLAQNLNDRQQLSVTGAQVTATGFAPFEISDIGRAIRVYDPALDRWFNGEILNTGGGGSTALVAWDPLISGSSTLSIASTGQWALGAFWDGNFPGHVAFFDDRLVFANTASNPQSFWMSVAADYLNFAPTQVEGQAVTDASAIFGTLNDAGLHAINWLAQADYSLLAATSNGVWRLYASEGVLSTASIQARRLDADGAAPVAPVVVGARVFYVGRSGRRVLSLSRDGLSADLTSTDLSLLSEHLFEPGIAGLAVQHAPNLRLWCQRTDGAVICLDHNAQDQRLGWTRQAFAAGSSILPVQTVALASGDRSAATGRGTEDQLWLINQRYIGGAWNRALVTLADALQHDAPDWPGHFLDDGLLVITPFPTTTVSGLEHLEGETVRVRAAEEDLGLFTVTGGQVTLPAPKRLISVGQPFESLAVLNDLDRGSAGGFSLTKARHLYDVRLRVWRSGPFEVGTNEPEFGSAVLPTEPQQFWPLNLPEPHSGAPLPAAFTGDLRVKRDEGGWARASALAWRTDGPFALNVLGVGLRLAGGD